MEHLYEKLTAYSASDAYPFHMPGHKRNSAVTGASLPYELDITEIDGFDDLHHAAGILRDAGQEAARVFGAGETRFLINGSTVGILSAVLGCTSPGGRILIARNCHKSVYHAVELGDLRAEYLYPPYDEETELNMGIRPEDVEAHLKANFLCCGTNSLETVCEAADAKTAGKAADANTTEMVGGAAADAAGNAKTAAAGTNAGNKPKGTDETGEAGTARADSAAADAAGNAKTAAAGADSANETEGEDGVRGIKARGRIQAVVITSPTYDGVVSDVGRIAEIVHRYGIPLIVDEAHGAHFGFHPYFPPNANALGADVVIHSVHKTLPSLTQTALLHMNGNLADRGRIDHFLDMLQSSSPSYVLLSSIDECVRVLSEEGEALFAAYVRRLKALREKLGALKNMRLLETESYDPSKVVISVKGLVWRESLPEAAGDECMSTDGCDGASAGRKCEGLGAKAKEEKTPCVTGPGLYRILCEEFHLQLEMAAGSYVVAMTSIADTDEGFDRLSEALTALDARMCLQDEVLPASDKRICRRPEKEAADAALSGGIRLIRPEQLYTVREAQAAAQTAANCEARNSGMLKDESGSLKESGEPEGVRFAAKEEADRLENVRLAPKEEAGRPEGVRFAPKESGRPEGVRFAPKEEAGHFCVKSVPWQKAAGSIALEYAYLYPPGIPLTVPGERISEELTSEIRKYEAAGLEIKGTRQKGRIEVLWDEYFV